MTDATQYRPVVDVERFLANRKRILDYWIAAAEKPRDVPLDTIRRLRWLRTVTDCMAASWMLERLREMEGAT